MHMPYLPNMHGPRYTRGQLCEEITETCASIAQGNDAGVSVWCDLDDGSSRCLFVGLPITPVNVLSIYYAITDLVDNVARVELVDNQGRVRARFSYRP